MAPTLPLPFTGSWLVSDLVYRALRASNVVKRAQGVPSSSQYQEGLTFLNQIVDELTARRPFAWATTFTLYTLTPNHQPHLLGPGLNAPDFGTPVVNGVYQPRPMHIESAELVLTGFGAPQPAPVPPATPAGAVNTNVDLQLNIRDSAWWAANSVKGISTNVPTDLYPEYDWDSLALWLWCIPSYPYGLRLETWAGLTQFQSIRVKFSAPPGYFNYLAFKLALALNDAYPEVPMPEGLGGLFRAAEKAVLTPNFKSPRCSSADWGTRGQSPRADFNYMTGTLPNYRG